MTLTKENMKTDPTGSIRHYSALVEDVRKMDAEQLARYMRLAFLGETDPDFLPANSDFWRTFSIHGGYSEPPTPGEFFGGTYAGADHEYRNRFEQALKDIFEECLNHEGSPMERERMLAAHAVEAVSYIRFIEGPDSPQEQFANALKERGRTPMTEVTEILRNLKYPDDSENELFCLARKLAEDQRYAL